MTEVKVRYRIVNDRKENTIDRDADLHSSCRLSGTLESP